MAIAVVMPNQGSSIILVVALLIGTPPPFSYTRAGKLNLSSSVSLCACSYGRSLSTVMVMGKRPSLGVMSNPVPSPPPEGAGEKALKGWKRSLALLETRIALVGRHDTSLRFIE